ncbi:MAG: MgtC/SapB family protein [Ruminococcaceae bacterium]|nr:MgtC/SapB family protein [Oscillospiraceae bacterium]
MGEWDVALRLLFAVMFGGLVGVERIITRHDAGIRTHMLVSIGSAAVMILSELLGAQYGGDISRIGAQVVSGIGFLGAGCIIVNGNKIKGLTTAAGLWATACIGLIFGAGYYIAGIIAAVIMLVAMLIFHPISSWVQKKTKYADQNVRVNVTTKQNLKEIINIADEIGLKTLQIDIAGEEANIVLEAVNQKQAIKFWNSIDTNNS